MTCPATAFALAGRDDWRTFGRQVRLHWRSRAIDRARGAPLQRPLGKSRGASLRIAEALQRTYPNRPDTRAARRTVDEVAFRSRRHLSLDYRPRYVRRLLAVRRRAPRGPHSALGGRGFSLLALVLGPVLAGSPLGGAYASCRTLSGAELAQFLRPS